MEKSDRCEDKFAGDFAASSQSLDISRKVSHSIRKFQFNGDSDSSDDSKSSLDEKFSKDLKSGEDLKSSEDSIANEDLDSTESSNSSTASDSTEDSDSSDDDDDDDDSGNYDISKSAVSVNALFVASYLDDSRIVDLLKSHGATIWPPVEQLDSWALRHNALVSKFLRAVGSNQLETVKAIVDKHPQIVKSKVIS